MLTWPPVGKSTVLCIRQLDDKPASQMTAAETRTSMTSVRRRPRHPPQSVITLNTRSHENQLTTAMQAGTATTQLHREK